MLSTLTDKEVFTTHPADLLVRINKDLPRNSEWLAWEPEVLIGSLPGLTKLSSIDKVLAVQASSANMAMTTTQAYPFCAVVAGYCNYSVPGAIQEHTVEEIFYTVNQLVKICDVLHGEDILFGGEVPGYIAASAHYYGWTVLPKSLGFAQELLTHLSSRVPLEGELVLVDSMDQVKNMHPEDVGEVLNQLIDSTEFTLVSQLIGCYVFDPTLITPE